MKAIKKILFVVLILGLTGAVDARNKKKDDSGIKGRIVSVSPNAITIKEKGGQQATIKMDANTTIEVDGISSKFNALQAGQRVRVQGGADGPATDIQATSKRSGHKKHAT